ncbi:hypothetical protein LDP37_00020 [Pseudomonas aeruginosa]|uniref:hypothetical protein n=1 Tax=Pseudomonas aeruginosa TaxID=287 RepID=UPI001EEF011A|nr:hypothetical protein [Pseudomonas aeruginosa]MCG7015172.1 hypothetical protein [Pseudomonas aeruginosa]MCG7027852.1 hypothetical protein [Pseudomonas aeruginosa]MCG7057071.1 hypothetical protein [Pseudomonas aeruginosa]MCG7062896.1 hypothetical protein [Pseudomonas aeruginosa]HDP4830711.1 hypothetical protein [Pseudomonas aeruginosa]
MTSPLQLEGHPALPKIDVTKDGNHYRLDWDYQTAPESNPLLESDYLDGYVRGAIAAFGIPAQSISCATACTGTIRKLAQDTATRLAQLLEEVLHPVVEREHARLKLEASLPHMRLTEK